MPGSATVLVSFVPTLKATGFEKVRRYLGSPLTGTPGAEVVNAMRASVAAEFRRGAWSRPDGGTTVWKPVEAFGTRPPTVPPLGGESGRLGRAWAGGSLIGVTGFNGLSANRAVIGVRSSRPWPIRHRGGDRAVGVSTTRQIVTPKMSRMIVGRYGVFLRPGRDISLESRPHATTNPALVAAIRKIVSKAIEVASK